MGFEISYFYHERKEEGGYNTEEKKELTKRVGNHFDDTTLDKAAAAIMAQLARRDIWVVDVKVQEYVKREIKFKEAKDGNGIVLKNKKFSLDSTANIVVEEEEIAPVPQINTNLAVRANLVSGTNLAPEAPVNQNRKMFYAIFEPEGWIDESRRRGLKFTVGKRYPVHRTKDDASDVGSIFYLTDDTNQIVEVNEKYFAIVGKGLVGDNEVDGGFSSPVENENRPRLMYETGRQEVVQQPSRRVNRQQIPEEWRQYPVDGEESLDQIPPMPQLRRDF